MSRHDRGVLWEHLAAGKLGGWFQLPADKRERAVDDTRFSWDDDESWAVLPEAAKIFACLTLPMVRGTPDRLFDTVGCLNCQDSGFQPGKEYGVWFCAACDKGLFLEAGYWRRVRFPELRGRKVASVSGQREFDAYAAAKPYRAERIKKTIAELVQNERAREQETT